MQNIFPEIIRINIPFIFILIIIFVSAGLSYFLYRQTNPESRSRLKYTLAIFRIITLVCLILLFFNPKLFFSYTEQVPRNVSVFTDISSSMGLITESENRPDSIRIASESLGRILNDQNLAVNNYYFSQEIYQDSPDSLNNYQGLTNYNNVFKIIAEQKPDQVVIISDGIRTDGPYPQSGNDAVVFSIGIGKTKPEPDFFIQDVDYKPVVYQGKEQQISVKIANTNTQPADARLILFSGQKVLASKTLKFEQENSEQEISFNYKLNTVGVNKLTLKLNSEQYDQNSKNNSYVYTQEVVKNKLRVGLFSAFPDYEHKFLNFVLQQSENIEVYSYLNIKNKIKENFSVDSLDIMIFNGFPGRFTDQQFLNRISSSIRQNGQSLIVLLNEYTNKQKLMIFKDYIPVQDITEKGMASNGQPLFSQKHDLNPILRLFENDKNNQQFWDAVPPISIYFSLDRLKNDADVLLHVPVPGGIDPILALSSEKSSNKSILLNGSGFWRWHFLLSDQNEIKEGYKKLIQNFVRWASGKRKYKPVILEVTRNTVNPGHEITLEGMLYDAQNEIIKNGQMLMNAISGSQQFTLDMSLDSNGIFHGSYRPSAEGTIIFNATGMLENKEIGNDKKTVEVVPYDREFIRTLQDTVFLKKIAHQTGGKYYSLKTLDQIAAELETQPRINAVSEEFDLRYKSWLLFLIIVVIAFEWILRKKNNLV